MRLRPTILAALLALPFATLLSGPSVAASGDSTVPAKTQDHAESGILWQKGDVDAAFALAKASNKPLFLYWGATWCPPCNQVKATIFNRQDFIERSRFFVPVYIDGDGPGAQKLGARFKVRGYPTMILFRPDGVEITRLPGEVDGASYLRVLAIGMGATHSVKDILQAVRHDAAKLSADDWRLLSFHSWESDEQLVAKKDLAATLQELAKACPAGDSAVRLDLIALVAAANAKSGAASGIDKPKALARLMATLADRRIARDNMDILTNYAGELSELLTEAAPAPPREKLLAAWHAALEHLAADATLSKTDRIGTLTARLTLARLATPSGALDPALLKTVREQVADTERATTDVFERQSVISAAAHALADGGLLDESDALLKAELKRSHSPYYFMLALAANAEQRQDKATAIDWYQQAYKGAQGPATRLQWGGTLLRGLIRLSPDDEAKIETTAKSVLKELLANTPDAFYERNSREVLRIGEHLLQWNKTGKHEAVLARMHTQLKDLCAKVSVADGQRATCEAMLAPGRQQAQLE